MNTTVRSPVDASNRISLLLQGAQAATGDNDDAARRLLKAVLGHDPNNDRALLGLVYLAEDGLASLHYLRRLLDAHPRHPEGRTALRWARQRTPNSGKRELPQFWADARTTVHQTRRLVFGMVVLAVLMAMGVLWGLNRPPAAPVSAEAAPAAGSPRNSAATAEHLMAVVKLSIPLFTLTPTTTATSVPTATPTPTRTPTPAPSRASVPVAGQPQTYNLSCESRSAADLAGFWGVPVDELEFLYAMGKSDNPHAGFVGDATLPPGSLPPYGYGVYTEPVAAALRAYGLDARPAYGLGLEGLQTELLAGRPVLVWATFGMRPYEPLQWTSSDSQTSTVVPFMHTYIVTGFDEQGFFLLDPYDASQQHYPIEIFLGSWSILDQMALIVNGPLQ